MIRYSLFMLAVMLVFQAQAQKKFINRKVAQKHYEGFMLMKDGKYREAKEWFDQAISDDPEAFFIYQNRAICKLNLRDTTGAMADFKKNIELEPANTESYYAVGDIYKTWKDTANATEYFSRSLAVANENFDTTKLAYMHQFLGNIDYEQNRFAEALAHFDKLTEYFPERSSYYIKKAVACYNLDSLGRMCQNLELAYIYGESVSCKALKFLCEGCSELENKRIKQPGNPEAVDMRLEPLLKDYHEQKADTGIVVFKIDNRQKKIYYNKNWEISAAGNAAFYRNVFWSPSIHFFGGSFTDYYISGSLLAKGTYNSAKLQGHFEQYYSNGQLAIKGTFNYGNPSGEWEFFYENNTPRMKVDCSDASLFNILFLKDKNGKDLITGGTGSVYLDFQTAEGLPLVITGQLENSKRTGQWQVKINGEPLVNEFYDKGKFKKGIVYDDRKKIKTGRSYITNWIFTPAYLNKLYTLKLESNDILFNYPFMMDSEMDLNLRQGK